MNDSPRSTWPLHQITPFLNYLSVECGLADNTIRAYQFDLRRFAAFCHDHLLTDPIAVTPVILQQYAHHLSDLQLATSTIARHLVAVRMFMRFQLLTGITDKDVCAVMESPKTWRRLPSVLPRQRTNALVTAFPPDDKYYLRNRALMELLYATGIRASEAADLCVSDINMQIGYLRCIGKGRKERIVPVHRVALHALHAYLQDLRPALQKTSSSDRLFISRTGRPLSRIEIWRLVRRAARLAGLTGPVTPHTLRHCFGSHLLQGGADLRSVQEMLGHADVTTTQIYTHVDSQHLRDIHKKYHPRA